MAEVGAVAATRLYIGPGGTLPLSPDAYVEITNISNIGDIGTIFTKIAVESVDSGYTRQIKGTQSTPTFPLVLNRKDDDAGQLEVLDASTDRNTLFNFRVVENDGEGDINASTKIYFKGRIYGFLRKYGGVNNLKQVSSDVEIEPDTITVVAAT